MHYSGGILSIDECYGSQLDHAILAVGWGTESGVDYLIVKNSWGTNWGEYGYIRMEVTDSYGGACGVLKDDSIPYTN